jgi:hypothetical protein
VIACPVDDGSLARILPDDDGGGGSAIQIRVEGAHICAPSYPDGVTRVDGGRIIESGLEIPGPGDAAIPRGVPVGGYIVIGTGG